MCDHPPTEPATYTHDGDPANLPAAAEVALIWLQFALRDPSALAELSTENKARLAQATRTLRESLVPHLPAVFLPKPRAFPEAVAVIVVTNGVQVQL